MSDRILVTPSALDVEKEVLGAMILDREALLVGMEMLTEECFYSDNNAKVFAGVKAIHKRREQVDIITVSQELKAQRTLDILGGPYAITELTANVQHWGNIESYCLIILQQYIRRQIIQTSSAITNKAYDDFYDPLALLDESQKDLKKITDQISQGKIVQTKDIFNEVNVAMNAPLVAGKSLGRSSGSKGIDDYIIAFQPGLKYTIAAQPGMGKSSIIIDMAIKLNQQGSPGAIFSLEMPAKKIMTRAISNICEIDSYHLTSAELGKAQLTQHEKELINHRMGLFRHDLWHIEDKPGLQLSHLKNKVRYLKRNFGIEWFMVDYIQLVQMSSYDAKGKSREQIVAEIAYGIKYLAREENIFAIDLSQLTKEVGKRESKIPTLSDLKESGAIEASADVIMFIFRPEHYGYTENKDGASTEGYTEIIIAKNRDGKTGRAKLSYTPKWNKFKDWQSSEDNGLSIPDNGIKF